MSTNFDPNTISLQALAAIVYALANPPPSLTLDQLGARGAWQDTDLIPVLPSGASALMAGTAGNLSELFSFLGAGAVPYVSGTLSPNTIYMMNTSSGPLTPALPAALSNTVGTLIIGVDTKDNAGTDTITYGANGTDVILDHASSANTWTQGLNNTWAALLQIAAGQWRAYAWSG